ncbi:MAG: hypothetical protein IKI09_05620 [Bacteroidales bacterium]|nr:hypothetical protein [Bacteroidales bacterium]
MNKLSIIAMLAALLLGFCSCGHQASKQFKVMEGEVSSIENQMNELTNCDDLQMLNFSILGLRSDLDNLIQTAAIPDAEITKIDEMLTNLEAAWSGKWAALECDQVVDDGEMDTSGEEEGAYPD